MSFNATTRDANGVTIVDVSGRVTLGDGATTLRDSLHQLVSSGHMRVLLNLAGVAALDSCGIGALVSSFAAMRHRGGKLKLLNLTNRTRNLLLLTKLYSVFEIYEDEGTAVQSFGELASAGS